MKTICIIGGGPAGLAAFSAISKSEGVIAVLLDSGNLHGLRQHNRAPDLGIGVGGAGLFSDGKFSFYPAGSDVYQLNNRQLLKEAHWWAEEQLSNAHIDFQKFEAIESLMTTQRSSSDKPYYASHGGLNERKKLIENIVDSCNGHGLVMANCNVSHIELLKDDNHQYSIEFTDNLSEKAKKIKADAIILATGKLGGLNISNQLSELKLTELRYEIGIRIETGKNSTFFKQKNLDIKKIWNEEEFQARTFCTCREGEIWAIPYPTISAISGRSDGPKTNFSNFGLLLRFHNTNLSQGSEIWKFVKNNPLNGKIYYESLHSFLKKENGNRKLNTHIRPWFPQNKFEETKIINLIGENAYQLFINALKTLISMYCDLDHEDTIVLFPAIEGVGAYPQIDGNLKSVNMPNIWCAGDIAGKFRGIIPAFISGFYAGESAVQEILRNRPVCNNLATHSKFSKATVLHSYHLFNPEKSKTMDVNPSTLNGTISNMESSLK